MFETCLLFFFPHNLELLFTVKNKALRHRGDWYDKCTILWQARIFWCSSDKSQTGVEEKLSLKLVQIRDILAICIDKKLAECHRTDALRELLKICCVIL